MTRGLLIAAGTLLAVIATALPARAHESRPLYIEVTEKAPLVFSVQWKIPPSVDVRNAPEISMPEGCSTPSDAGTAGREARGAEATAARATRQAAQSASPIPPSTRRFRRSYASPEFLEKSIPSSPHRARPKS